MNTAFVFIPLSFNGPCISENGPKVLEFFLNKKNYHGDYYRFDLKWNESPKNYLKRVYKNLKQIEKRYSKIIVFGGNHLSLLPIYNLMSKKNYSTLTLDAHRDYLYNNGMITHGSFMRFVKPGKNKRYIMGFRDSIQLKDKYNFFDQEISAKNIINTKKTNTLKEIRYVDIDVDVLDEAIFPYTSCPINNGLTLKKLYEIFEIINFKNVKILSFSEYAYVLDKEKKGLKIIFDIIDKYLSK